MGSVFEFRGVDNLVYAKVLTDTAEEFKCDTPKSLSPVAEIGKTVETSSESKFYDNKAMLIINSEGADEITCTVAPLDIQTLAEITGKQYDETTGALIDGLRSNDYFAIGYRTKGTDGQYRYVWRFKGTFAIPDETVATEDDGTDANNQELVFTGIHTTHEFTKGGSCKGIVVDTRKDLADVSTFFTEVTTPDTLKAKTATQATE